MLYLACVRCGAIYLPLNTAYTLAELDYFIGDAEPRLVVVTSKSRSGIETDRQKARSSRHSMWMAPAR